MNKNIGKRQKLLVIEDEADILELLVYNLSREGYAVSGCRDGLEGLQQARQELPGLILLDLMLPGMDGIEVCTRLKADHATRAIPIVMVTAKGEESDIVLGLGVGADDYIVKPFSPRELVARVKAVLRRGPLADEAGSGRIVRQASATEGGLAIDPAKFEVTLDGETIVCTATEFKLLHLLAANPGRVFTRDSLLSRVIGDDVVVLERNIDVHIRALRKKLGGRRELIETIRGVGYRFKEED
jgi:two-component system, OmpR family, alkaline phosphatase synthesis response regulator PhoP